MMQDCSNTMTTVVRVVIFANSPFEPQWDDYVLPPLCDDLRAFVAEKAAPFTSVNVFSANRVILAMRMPRSRDAPLSAGCIVQHPQPLPPCRGFIGEEWKARESVQLQHLVNDRVDLACNFRSLATHVLQ